MTESAIVLGRRRPKLTVGDAITVCDARQDEINELAARILVGIASGSPLNRPELTAFAMAEAFVIEREIRSGRLQRRR